MTLRSSAQKVLVLSVCTNSCGELDNFMMSLNRLGYDFEILGMGEKWGGWAWRTQMYVNRLSTLPASYLVILCDATDILFMRPPDVFVEKMKDKMDKVLIGAESHCCTGIYAMSPFDRYNIIKDTRKLHDGRNRFVNGGFLAGRADNLLALLRDNIEEEDDQAGLQEKIVNGDTRMVMDVDNKIIGNINKQSWMKCVR